MEFESLTVGLVPSSTTIETTFPLAGAEEKMIVDAAAEAVATTLGVAEASFGKRSAAKRIAQRAAPTSAARFIDERKIKKAAMRPGMILFKLVLS
jgi:hypothetical protein